jgi:hypothetical protein
MSDMMLSSVFERQLFSVFKPTPHRIMRYLSSASIVMFNMLNVKLNA